MAAIVSKPPVNLNIDMFSPEFKANPFPHYAYLREERPLFNVRMSGMKSAWLLTRYEDVVALLKDDVHYTKERRKLSDPGPMGAVFSLLPSSIRALERNMLDTDAPDHTRLRSLVHKAFTPRLIENMAGRIQQISDELIQKMQGQSQVDLLQAFALPLPITVITEVIGVPKNEQRQFHHWSNRIVNVTGAGDFFKVIPAMWSFMRYVRHLARLRRADPQDDLLSALVQAEEAGEKLSEDELSAMIFILLVAGHETTVNLIASGMLALMQHPEQREKLRANPALARSAVEELLRFVTPVDWSTERYVLESFQLYDQTIPAGAVVFGGLGSANRDPNIFTNPDTLDLMRENNKHLAFGQGIHYCVGSPLARMEGQIAFNTLLRSLPNLRLAVEPEQLRWRKSLAIRGLAALPVKI